MSRRGSLCSYNNTTNTYLTRFTEQKSVVIGADDEGNNPPISSTDEDMLATIATLVTMATAGGEEGDKQSNPRSDSPIDTKGNAAYVSVALHDRKAEDSKYVEMPVQQK